MRNIIKSMTGNIIFLGGLVISIVSFGIGLVMVVNSWTRTFPNLSLWEMLGIVVVCFVGFSLGMQVSEYGLDYGVKCEVNE